MTDESRRKCICYISLAIVCVIWNLYGCCQEKPTYKETPAEDSPLIDRDNKEWEAWYTEHTKTCPTCGGDGSAPPALCKEAFAKFQEILREGTIQIDCWDCKGTGKITYPAGNFFGVIHEKDYEDDCYRCSGTGKCSCSNMLIIKARGNKEFVMWFMPHRRECSQCNQASRSYDNNGPWCTEAERRATEAASIERRR